MHLMSNILNTGAQIEQGSSNYNNLCTLILKNSTLGDWHELLQWMNEWNEDADEWKSISCFEHTQVVWTLDFMWSDFPF